MKKLLAVVTLVCLVGCGPLVFENPPNPSPDPTATPVATATPTPTATPSPLPTTTPTPIPMCSLPASTGPYTCDFTPENFQFDQEFMIAQIAAELNGKNVGFDGIVPPEKEAAYSRELTGYIQEMGHCAISGADVEGAPREEVWLKLTNERSFHVDVVRGNGEVIVHFAAECTPAAF